jgi:hypothetical protein
MNILLASGKSGEQHEAGDEDAAHVVLPDVEVTREVREEQRRRSEEKASSPAEDDRGGRAPEPHEVADRFDSPDEGSVAERCKGMCQGETSRPSAIEPRTLVPARQGRFAAPERAARELRTLDNASS